MTQMENSDTTSWRKALQKLKDRGLPDNDPDVSSTQAFLDQAITRAQTWIDAAYLSTVDPLLVEPEKGYHATLRAGLPDSIPGVEAHKAAASLTRVSSNSRRSVGALARSRR